MDYNQLFKVKKKCFGDLEFSFIKSKNDNFNKIAYFLVYKIFDVKRITEVKQLMTIKFYIACWFFDAFVGYQYWIPNI
jgi:hypothetical protein